MRINSAQSGMTLIQMAGILLIISIMMVPFFQIQSLIKKTEIRDDSKGQVADVSQALVQFALTNGRYPLPANPVHALTDVRSGIEATAWWADELARDDGVLNGPGNRCRIANPNDLMLCVDGNATPYAEGSAENRVIIGTVPYAVLGLTPAQSLDEYGNKLTYAVTYGLTKSATFRNDRGNIRVRDQAATPNVVKVSAYTSDKAHFVVISHGQNRLGAFPGNGGNRACTGTSPDSALEEENCDIDSSFRILSSRPDGDVSTTAFSETNWLINPGTNTANTFDDLVAFRTSINTGPWTARVDPTAGANRYQTYFSEGEGTDNIFVGGDAPINDPLLIARLKSKGAGQVQVTGNVQASRIETDYLCSIKSASNNTVASNNQAQACLLVSNFVQPQNTLSLPLYSISVSDANGAEVNEWMRAVVSGRANSEQNGFLNIQSTGQNIAQINPGAVRGYTGTTPTPNRLCSAGASGLNNADGEVKILCD